MQVQGRKNERILHIDLDMQLLYWRKSTKTARYGIKPFRSDMRRDFQASAN